MGGNAFPNLNVVRLEREDYYTLETSVLDKLRNYFFNKDFLNIPVYSEKQSFGDMDLIYHSEYIKNNHLKEIFNTSHIIRNGDVISFAYSLNQSDYFQVDLIKADPENFNFARNYFSYNDLGNLMGRVYHRAGFKFGHKGLSYVIREEGNDNHVLKEVVVSTDWENVLSLMGYDYKRWCQGFSTLEDVFKFAVSSPIVSRVIFRLDQTNHAARIRDRKRKIYNIFERENYEVFSLVDELFQ